MAKIQCDDVKTEKKIENLRYLRRFKRLMTLIRLLELFVLLIVVGRFTSRFQFALSPVEYLRGGFTVSLISPRFVFVAGNLIVVLLFIKSGKIPSKVAVKSPDFYEEYVEYCRSNNQLICGGVRCKQTNMKRSRSESTLSLRMEERRREFTRNMTAKCRRSEDSLIRTSSHNSKDHMTGDEFRQTVDAFIARQQRLLREE